MTQERSYFDLHIYGPGWLIDVDKSRILKLIDQLQSSDFDIEFIREIPRSLSENRTTLVRLSYDSDSEPLVEQNLNDSNKLHLNKGSRRIGLRRRIVNETSSDPESQMVRFQNELDAAITYGGEWDDHISRIAEVTEIVKRDILRSIIYSLRNGYINDYRHGLRIFANYVDGVVNQSSADTFEGLVRTVKLTIDDIVAQGCSQHGIVRAFYDETALFLTKRVEHAIQQEKLHLAKRLFLSPSVSILSHITKDRTRYAYMELANHLDTLYFGNLSNQQRVDGFVFGAIVFIRVALRAVPSNIDEAFRGFIGYWKHYYLLNKLKDNDRELLVGAQIEAIGGFMAAARLQDQHLDVIHEQLWHKLISILVQAVPHKLEAMDILLVLRKDFDEVDGRWSWASFEMSLHPPNEPMNLSMSGIFRQSLLLMLCAAPPRPSDCDFDIGHSGTVDLLIREAKQLKEWLQKLKLDEDVDPDRLIDFLEGHRRRTREAELSLLASLDIDLAKCSDYISAVISDVEVEFSDHKDRLECIGIQSRYSESSADHWLGETKLHRRDGFVGRDFHGPSVHVLPPPYGNAVRQSELMGICDATENHFFPQYRVKGWDELLDWVSRGSVGDLSKVHVLGFGISRLALERVIGDRSPTLSRKLEKGLCSVASVLPARKGRRFILVTFDPRQIEVIRRPPPPAFPTKVARADGPDDQPFFSIEIAELTEDDVTRLKNQPDPMDELEIRGLLKVRAAWHFDVKIDTDASGAVLEL